jgi:hypothetical protein
MVINQIVIRLFGLQAHIRITYILQMQMCVKNNFRVGARQCSKQIEGFAT